MKENDPRIGQSIRDVVVVGGLLGLINALVARSDFGWVNLNPTPWLLLPVLIGGRYGIVPGLLSGLLSGLTIAVFQEQGGVESAPAFARLHPFYFTALVFAGFLAGEVNRMTRARNRELSGDHRDLFDQNARLSAELELAREARQDLQRHLALLNAPLASLDDDLRKLITLPCNQFMPALLAALHQHTRISSAALYQREGGSLRQLAVLHPTKHLAEKLILDEIPLAAEAIESDSIAMVSDPMQTTAAQPFLAALPWKGSKGNGVLLVQDMPLQAFDSQMLARMELIVDWALSLSRYRDDLQSTGDPARLLGLDEFLVLIGKSLEAERIHHLPSIIVKADFTDLSEAADPQMERKLKLSLPSTAVCTRLPNNGSLVVLLPFGGESEARALGQSLTATGAKLRLAQYLVVGPATLNDFWAHVMLP